MNKKFLLLSCMYIGTLIMCNIISIKLCSIGGIIISAGILTYSLTFLILNVVTEIWGRKTVFNLIWAGFLINIFTFIVIKIVVLMPAASFFDNKSFIKMFDYMPRIIIACQVAFLVSQYQNVWTFNWIKEKTNNKFLWLRNSGSTITSQFLDCTLFYLIAFAPVGLSANEMGWNILFHGMLLSYLFKIVIAIFDTPFCYLLVLWAKDEKIRLWRKKALERRT